MKDLFKNRYSSTFLLFIVCATLGLLLGLKKMNETIKNPIFANGKIIGLIDGTKGTSYILYEYEVNSKKMTGKQSRIFTWSKRRLTAIKGKEYLVVYNKEEPLKSHMLNVEINDSNRNELANYSVDSLKKRGLISFWDF